MPEYFSLTLEAHNPARNVHRWYQLTLEQDLFGCFVLVVAHGRSGQRGQESRFASQNAEELRELARTKLRRRASAPRRLGCAYLPTACNKEVLWMSGFALDLADLSRNPT